MLVASSKVAEEQPAPSRKQRILLKTLGWTEEEEKETEYLIRLSSLLSVMSFPNLIEGSRRISNENSEDGREEKTEGMKMTRIEGGEGRRAGEESREGPRTCLPTSHRVKQE